MVRYQTNKCQARECKLCEKSRKNCEFYEEVNNGFKCCVCRKIIELKYLRLHMLCHFGERLFSCELCGKKSLQNFVIRERHFGEKKLSLCHNCLTTIHQNYDFSKNYLTNGKDFPLTCLFCYMNFREYTSFKAHVDSHIKDIQTAYAVNFYESSQFYQHIVQGHRQLKLIECFICAMKFTTRESLKIHLKSHKKSPFKCFYCRKQYFRKHKLEIHVRTHTGERPFKCLLCPKSFTTADGLRSHIRIHTGERPFKCHWCPKTYTLSSSLTNHLRTHINQTFLKLSLDDKSKSNKNSQQQTYNHILQKSLENRCDIAGNYELQSSNQEPFVCNLCSKKFKQVSNLYSHYQTVHNRQLYIDLNSTCIKLNI